MIKLATICKDIRTVAIAGHVRPDGDCVGSCLAVYNYIREQFPQVEVHVYLESFNSAFSFLKGADEVEHACEAREFDLFIALDCGDKERLGDAVKCFDLAKTTICLDHHISNTGYAMVNHILPQASSTSEMVFEIMEEEQISRDVASCIYLGIVHDTGVFQYSCTSQKTMETAGKLMAKGIDFTAIIEDTFYKKTFAQNRILGKALVSAELKLDGICIVSTVSKEDMEACGATGKDLDGIASQLRVTDGVEVAVFLYETADGEYKVSMRAKNLVDVSRIAASFGGGGHVKAAGCTMKGNAADVVDTVVAAIADQLAKRES